MKNVKSKYAECQKMFSQRFRLEIVGCQELMFSIFNSYNLYRIFQVGGTISKHRKEILLEMSLNLQLFWPLRLL